MKRVLLLILLSFALSFLGLYLVSRKALLEAALYRPERWNVWALPICILAFAGLWLVPALKLRVLAKAQNVSLSFISALAVHILGVFGAAITPSGSGGGPAIAAALQRLGVPWGMGIGMAVQIFILDLIVFAWAVPLSLIYLILSLRDDLPLSVQVLALVSAALAIGLAVALSRFPILVVRLILWLARWRLLQRGRRRLGALARDYYRSAKVFMAMPAPVWVKLQLLGAAGWLSSFVLFWGLLTLYSVGVHLPGVLSVLSIVTLTSFVVPTPGASGFTELAVGLSIGTQVPPVRFAAPLLLWRLASFYLAYLLGPVTGWLLLLRRPPGWLRRLWRRQPES